MRIVVATTLDTSNTFSRVKNLETKHDEHGELTAEFDFVVNPTGNPETNALQHCTLSKVRTLLIDMNN